MVKDALKPLEGLQALTDQIGSVTTAVDALKSERAADREAAAASTEALAAEMSKLADRAEGNMAFMERQVAEAKATNERHQTGFADLRRLLSDRHNVLKIGLESLGVGIQTIAHGVTAIAKQQEGIDHGQIEFAAQIAAITERIHRNEETVLSSIRVVEQSLAKPLLDIGDQLSNREAALQEKLEVILASINRPAAAPQAPG